MKRVLTTIALLTFVLGVSLYSIFKVKTMREEMILYIEAVTAAAASGDSATLERSVEELCAYWEGEERTLIHFVRHTHIDQITQNISRLPAAAAYQNYSDLFADLASIRWQVEHIWESELPTLDNILVCSL